MELQVTLTIKAEGAPLSAVAEAVYKHIDKLVTEKNALITSYNAVAIDSTKTYSIAFPQSIDT